ncbi:RNA polymerase sigma factor [Sphingopyxis sp.]|uniref:RNA polymerase sigma factor n=1 Tax=Sphingopyxis sp. TaxID=1908224 RepID=UPI002B48B203|nr:sigma-70 family RNA polymerase sigma factor [Sphingopyxis sp.]HJS11623.1 sigma-70 family RNA polymerase sigma factor [Sphingopyxis sp.]
MSDRQEALMDMHRDHRPGLLAFFLRRVHNHSEAEDLTQEVFARIAAMDDREMRRADAYIFQVAANLLRDRGRRMAVRSDYVAGARATEGTGIDPIDPHRVAAGREAIHILRAGLDDLPERTRQIFLLFRYEHLDHRTIADSFGISTSAVQKHIYRAMAYLVDRLGEAE